MKKDKFFRLLLLITWVFTIFAFSLQTGSTSGGLSDKVTKIVSYTFFCGIDKIPPVFLDNILSSFGFLIRKCAHISEYAILFLIAFYAFKGRYKIIKGLILCIIIASLDELLQTFIALRNGNIIDVTIDTIGSFIGVFVVLFYNKFIKE